jgi:hypothetical protein
VRVRVKVRGRVRVGFRVWVSQEALPARPLLAADEIEQRPLLAADEIERREMRAGRKAPVRAWVIKGSRRNE